jgi:hypothetical protein
MERDLIVTWWQSIMWLNIVYESINRHLTMPAEEDDTEKSLDTSVKRRMYEFLAVFYWSRHDGQKAAFK